MKFCPVHPGNVLLQEVLPDPDGAQQVLELRRSWVEPSDYFPTSETGVVPLVRTQLCFKFWKQN
jgi:hypothetical protein